MISETAHSSLVALGQRLRALRIARNEPQAVLAARLGVSVPTLRAMEQGQPTTQVGHWAELLWILDRLDELDGLLPEQENLFAQVEQGGRRRARGGR